MRVEHGVRGIDGVWRGDGGSERGERGESVTAMEKGDSFSLRKGVNYLE